MRSFLGFATTVVVLAACSSSDPAVGGITPPAAPPVATIPRSEVERDLAFELHRGATEALDHERDPRLEAWLVNLSTTRSYPVVLANDGSEVGWREPHAFFTVELLRGATWAPAPPELGGRCGTYARDWEEDVVTLGPGQRVMMPWMSYPISEMGDATKVRVVGHYEYGTKARDKSKVPLVLHAMPEYALASKPIEIPVAHPYTLELRLRGPLPRSSAAPLASAIDVAVENRSGERLPVGTSETGAQLWFEAVFKHERGETEETLFVATEPTYASKDVLRPGARKSIVTAATRTDIGWSVSDDARLLRMRALWRIWDVDASDNSNVRRVVSPWVNAP